MYAITSAPWSLNLDGIGCSKLLFLSERSYRRCCVACQKDDTIVRRHGIPRNGRTGSRRRTGAGACSRDGVDSRGAGGLAGGL